MGFEMETMHRTTGGTANEMERFYRVRYLMMDRNIVKEGRRRLLVAELRGPPTGRGERRKIIFTNARVQNVNG